LCAHYETDDHYSHCHINGYSAAYGHRMIPWEPFQAASRDVNEIEVEDATDEWLHFIGAAPFKETDEVEKETTTVEWHAFVDAAIESKDVEASNTTIW
jgi:hypothetical protein